MELDILRAIQSIANPFFDVFFQLVTMAGEQIVLILLFCAVFWLHDKQLGYRMGATIVASLLVNGTLKAWLNLPRPIGEPGIRSLRVETATGSSFPSGHTQGAAAAYTSLALGLRKKWLSIACGIVIVLVGFSRLYLGVHYPKDVVAGLLLGVGCAFLCRVWFKKTRNFLNVLILLCVLMTAMFLFFPSVDGFKSAGLAYGLLIGYVVEQKNIRFTTDFPARRKIGRYLIGILVVAVCYAVPKLLIPEIDNGVVRAFVYALRYAFVSFAVTVLAPLTFTKLRF